MHSNPKRMTSQPNMSTTTDQLRFVLLGKTGNGKSATGNALLHSTTAFHSVQSARSVTKDCQAECAQWTCENGKNKEILIVDTPGFFDTDVTINNQLVEEKIASQIFEKTSPGVHAFLIVLHVGRFSPEEKQTVDFIRTIFGEDAVKYCIVVFTHADQLEEGQSIDDFIADSQELKDLTSSCGNRRIAINNKSVGQRLKSKTQELLQLIDDMVKNNGGTYYTNEKYREIERQRQEERERMEEKAREEKRKEIEAEIRRQNEVISVRTETQTIEVGRNSSPIFSTERRRKRDLFSRAVSVGGSGYRYYQVQVGTTVTINWREEQREVKTLRSGLEQYGDWRTTRTWSTT